MRSRYRSLSWLRAVRFVALGPYVKGEMAAFLSPDDSSCAVQSEMRCAVQRAAAFKEPPPSMRTGVRRSGVVLGAAAETV